jgi:hypothetical protein
MYAAQYLDIISLQKDMLGRLCQEIETYKTAKQLESLFSSIQLPEQRNALLHCVNHDSPLGWTLRNEAMEKRKEFDCSCDLERPKFKLAYVEFLKGSKSCVKYMKKNNLQLVASSKLVFETDPNDSDFVETTRLLKEMDMKFCDVRRFELPRLDLSNLRPIRSLDELFNTPINN